MCELLHDIGDTLGCYNHPDVAAAILKPFVSEANLRDAFSGHEHYARTEEFIALYDNPAFDAKAEIAPIGEFEPMLRRVFAQPRNSIYKAALQRQGGSA